jgi:REP element-mobilizing transposase RayT
LVTRTSGHRPFFAAARLVRAERTFDNQNSLAFIKKREQNTVQLPTPSWGFAVALTPIYTPDNCTFTGPLQWGLSVFWRTPQTDASWFDDLKTAVAVDDLHLLGHRFARPDLSQFIVSTRAHTAPVFLVQRIKGRLQYLVRQAMPKALSASYALRSFGRVTREVTENYVASQLDHHRMADERVQEMLEGYQVVREEVDLSIPRSTSQGRYWYNLHLVFVHRERWAEVREEVIGKLHDMVVRVCEAKGYVLSRAGLLADHLHLALGCPIDASPAEIALGFLNNLAFVHGMKAIYQFGAYVGTFGEYDQGAVVSTGEGE